MLSNQIRLLFCTCLISLSLQTCAAAQDVKRFALVIGNTNYRTAPLKNAGNDANAMAQSLTALGFQVSLFKDGNLSDLTSQVQRFYSQVQKDQYSNKLALIYYAGHAIQVNHHNYIVPLAMKFDNYSEFMSGLYKVDSLFTEINKSPDLQSIIILDACRNNPFESNAVANNGNMSQGLAPVKAPSNTMIAFATAPGGVAADGADKNGVYTKHLLQHIAKQVRVEEVFKKVRSAVAKETANRQIPWEHSSLLNEVFFSPPKNRDIPDLISF
ncbi:caspase family protein [uncultured Paraglaciecola sp.]|uniref:caspase family protein n=1 Tax=uncultured Paraglaciecola sp. TaxID=1765024 RepID=UPI002620EE4E|nr:caspase family protein [uncultured Paraglaciecola sp.]